ncbi:histidine phosphotransferase family protein [Azospirillum rugosum]|uniref:Histidine phosphotransferase ChpT n=1 Tax=Azospirillum rugosum TaxID=416170 RepID=A0ABS4SCY9_9PROT|nr:histidine phosphotransferase family protein [Azospirillum rugosum]MBP2290352.1 histidine phosphotransferase ChpT [Azospirillum rugosum]MDQ0527828.1 histidine phosphotransferase ChpT [Azospirillum rugosum]
MPLDIRVIELLASRICHDLVSPVGAIRNGLELIEEMEDDEPAGGGFAGEAIKLIEHSSGQADRRLRVFRLAYGLAGREQKGFGDTRASAQGLLEGGRTRLDWPAGVPNDQLAFKRGAAKALLNVIILADEALTHGGTIAVAATGDEQSGRFTITATGRPGALKPEAEAALNGSVAPADLTPRTIHAYMTGRFAEDDGYRVAATPSGPETLVFTVEW